MIVGRLLNQGNVNEAGRVCKQFSHFSQDYEIITNMCHLADGTLAVQFLNEKLISLTKVSQKKGKKLMKREKRKEKIHCDQERKK